MAQLATAAGPQSCRPFDGPRRPELLAKWHDVHTALGQQCGWDEAMRDLSDPLVREVFPSLRHVASRADGDIRGAQALARCDLSTPQGRHSAARLRSSAGGAASAWLEAIPTAHSTTLSTPDFVMAGRHRLGYGLHSTVRQLPCSCRAGQASAHDHAMVCDATAKWRTFRHDIYATAWRRVIRMAGLAASAEPRYGALVGSAARAAAAGLRRGDVLALLEHALTVLDAVVTHPGAATYVAAAARTAGSAARAAEREKVRSWLKVGRDSGYEFVPLAVETYGRMGVQASRFLSTLGDVAARGGVSKAAFVRMAHRELSCALVKGMGGVYATSQFTLARAVGRMFQEGSPVPVADSVPE